LHEIVGNLSDQLVEIVLVDVTNAVTLTTESRGSSVAAARDPFVRRSCEDTLFRRLCVQITPPVSACLDWTIGSSTPNSDRTRSLACGL
jgi:hypothetical protein